MTLCLSYVLASAALSAIPGPQTDLGWLEEHETMLPTTLAPGTPIQCLEQDLASALPSCSERDGKA